MWISLEVALAVHERLLAEHGGREGLRDRGLLECALARPRQVEAYGDTAPDTASLAASLAFALVRNMPFLDGNKRTAHACYLAFLALNRIDCNAGDEEKYVQLLALTEGIQTEANFASWLRSNLGPAR